MGTETGSPIYRRVLLKLSGEALLGGQPFGIDPETIQAALHFHFKGHSAFGKRFRQGGLHHAEVFIEAQRLQADLGATSGGADALAQARDTDGSFADVLHVLGDARIQIVIHQDQAGKALNDCEEVVQLVSQSAEEFLVESFALLLAQIQIGREDKLHVRERAGWGEPNAAAVLQPER